MKSPNLRKAILFLAPLFFGLSAQSQPKTQAEIANEIANRMGLTKAIAETCNGIPANENILSIVESTFGFPISSFAEDGTYGPLVTSSYEGYILDDNFQNDCEEIKFDLRLSGWLK